jgi:FG-GAP-like repeat/Glycosyl hydrolases family 8/FG-GAP repeat
MTSILKRSFRRHRQAVPMVQDGLKRRKGANSRATRLAGGLIASLCLFVALLLTTVPSYAETPATSLATNSKYYDYYNTYLTKGKFWKQVATINGVPVKFPNGMKVTGYNAIFNASGTEGAGVISETTSYAMILAALYDDQDTFDNLSATVQTGIQFGKIQLGKTPDPDKDKLTNLIPWWLVQDTSSTDASAFIVKDLNSASDADINIALAYIYADMATLKNNYNWTDGRNGSPTYKAMALNYIAAIRGGKDGKSGDFSSTDSPDNQYVLADGAKQALLKFSDGGSYWHPDYSDIRAYQLFRAYQCYQTDTPDQSCIDFWTKAIATTVSCWKAIFNFGPKDGRNGIGEDGNREIPTKIDPMNTFVMLSNPKYGSLKASSVYTGVAAERVGEKSELYWSDSMRLPIRLLNFINATQNIGNPHIADVTGIANANLTALGTSYLDMRSASLSNEVSILAYWSQNNTGYIQNFNAAGLFAYTGNSTLKLSYVLPKDRKPNDRNPPATDKRMDAYTDLDSDKKFGSNGMNGTIGIIDGMYFDLSEKQPDGFNASLTLWGLTVSKAGAQGHMTGETPLQSYILSYCFPKCGTDTSPQTATHDFKGDSKSDIVWRNVSGDTSVWLMNGATVVSSSAIGTVPTTWSIVGQRDFNGDGKADLLWSNTNGDTSIWLMNGTTVSSTPDLGFVGNGWSIVGTGDFNGDGFGDILWRNTNGDTSIWLMTGNATQVSVLSATDLGLIPTSWSVAQTGDFNGDGKADILWHNTNGDTSVWLMTASGTQMQVLSATDLGVVPTSWTIAGTGDFNGDGKSDILWHNTNGDTSIWLMTSNGTQVQVLSTTDLGFVPTSWNAAVTGDFNGDGKSDILWSNTNGDTSIWFMTTNGTQVQVLSVSDLGVVPPSWVVQGAGAD